jgi:hypothetical protein
MHRLLIGIIGRLHDMARLMGPAKTSEWGLPYQKEIITPKILFLALINRTMPEASSCMILRMQPQIKMFKYEKPLETSNPGCPTFVHVAKIICTSSLL